MKVFGIDYSMSCPAVCIIDTEKRDATDLLSGVSFHFLTKVKRYEGTFSHNVCGECYPIYSCDDDRYSKLANWTYKKISDCDCGAIEGYSYGSRGNVFNIGELTGALKQKLYSHNLDYVLYSPPSIKKYATGSGRADKELMHKSFLEKTKLNMMSNLGCTQKKIGNPVSDLVDSYFIADMLISKNYNSPSL